MRQLFLCMPGIIALMLSLSGPSQAEMAKVVRKLPSPDGRYIAFEKDTWGKSGPDYPQRCEIWLSDRRGGAPRKLHEFVLESGSLRQRVCIEEWTADSSAVIVSFRKEPASHMDDRYKELLQSALWHMPINGPARRWKRGIIQGGIIGVRGTLVCVGTDLSFGGGAGLPDWREFGTVLVSDLEGTEKHRFTGAKADADWSALRSKTSLESCLSPDGRFVAVLSAMDPPAMEGRLLQVWSLDSDVSRKVEKALDFRWTKDPGVLDIGTLEGKRRYNAERGSFINSSR
ncbi:MAG: hypothetical protein RDV48_24375 [Candidatus Eremiobacteraeota bacterium]|nr:hypothetical protein [Candidatus Eremiobacteraeota bacterium]